MVFMKGFSPRNCKGMAKTTIDNLRKKFNVDICTNSLKAKLSVEDDAVMVTKRQMEIFRSMSNKIKTVFYLFILENQLDKKLRNL